jgi:hypothetical protein
MARKSTPTSETVLAIGPSTSSVGESGITCSVLTLPMLSFKPTVPHSDEGMRTEPPVSVPMLP